MDKELLMALNKQISASTHFISLDFSKENWIKVKVPNQKKPVKMNCTEALKEILRQRIINSIYYSILESESPTITQNTMLTLEING